MTTSLSSKTREKENKPPIMPQEVCNQAVASSGNVKPISVYRPVHPRPPLKSILKVRPPALGSAATTSSSKDPETTLQDMSDQLEPLQCQDYLQGPIETICNSLKVENIDDIMHDISEAYSLLSARLRAEAGAMLSSGDIPALRIWHDHRNEFVDAVSRDIRLAFNVSGSETRARDFFSSSSASRSELNEDEIKRGRDASQLCQCTIVIVSDIFRLPALQQIFTKSQLSYILSLVLEVASAEFVHIPSSAKIYRLVIWTLQSQRLPQDLISLEYSRISRVFEDAIRVDAGTGNNKAIYDGLKGINDQLSKNNNDVFLHAVAPVLPNILPYLISPDVSLRLQSGLILGTFARVLLRPSSSLDSRMAVSNMIGDFVDSFRRSVSKRSLLSQMFQPCLANDNPITPAEGPLWAISVISSLIILSGPNLFSRPRSLRLSMFALAEVKRHKNPIVRSLLPAAWKCLVWAFAQLPLWSSAGDDVHAYHSIFDQVYRVIKQELTGDTAVSLVGCLLACKDEYWSKSNVSKSLEVLKDLLQNGADGRKLGLAIFYRMLNHAGKPYADTVWIEETSVPVSLLDGSIATTDWKHLETGIVALESNYDTSIRALNEEEFVREWAEIFSVWELYIRSYMNCETSHLPPELLEIWQGLLLIKTQLSQEKGHLTADAEVTSRISALLLSLVVCDSAATETRTAQHLTTARQLWAVTRNVFCAEWLAQMAETLLAALLTDRLAGDNKQAKDVWEDICVDLISNSSSSVLNIIFKTGHEKQEVELSRQLWLLSAKGYRKRLADSHNIKELISLLKYPLEIWVLDDATADMWRGILQLTASLNNGRGGWFTSAVNELVDYLRCTTTECSRLNAPIILSIVFSCMASSTVTSLPDLLSSTSYVLDQCYSSEPVTVESVFKLLVNLRLILRGKENFSLPFQNLEHIEKGLIVWIEDRLNRLSNEQYNDYVIPVYCDIINCIKAEEMELESLYKHSDFFSSVFDRSNIPWPALGPLAFKALWDKLSSKDFVDRSICPKKLWSCITGLYDAFGGTLPVWLTVDHQSSSQSSCVPSPARILSRVIQASNQSNCVSETNNPQATPNEHVLLADETIGVRESQEKINLVAQQELSSDDYGAWELCVRSPDIRSLRGEPVSTPPAGSSSNAENMFDVTSPDSRTIRKHQPPTPESKQYHKRRKMDDRFRRTPPMQSPKGFQTPTAVRRAKTTPLDALEHLRVTVLNGASDMGTQDLADSAKYVCEIAGVLKDCMIQRLRGRENEG